MSVSAGEESRDAEGGGDVGDDGGDVGDDGDDVGDDGAGDTGARDIKASNSLIGIVSRGQFV